MGNLKIRVKDESESKEAQELFFELGFEWKYKNIGKRIYIDDSVGFLYADRDCITTGEKDYGLRYFEMNSNKQITLPKLRDLVVLKRNDVGDATHGNAMYLYVKLSDGWYYFDEGESNKWLKSTGGQSSYYESLKLIEKTMKEYLTKMQDGSYKLIPSKMGDDDIEVPEGANIYAEPKDGIRTFWSNDYQWFDGCVVRDIELEDSEYTFNEWAIDWDAKILWQRYNQPEELPPIGDEPSLNDQYAEIEKVREKYSHYKKDISHLNVLDIYRVTELFKAHSCGAHIVKKALCSGQRGHKDLLTDIQDIIDTAERWKQMIQEDVNDNS